LVGWLVVEPLTRVQANPNEPGVAQTKPLKECTE
jgi:hypothetical protein